MNEWIGIGLFWLALLWLVTGLWPIPSLLVWVVEKLPTYEPAPHSAHGDFGALALGVLILGAGVAAIIVANV